MIYPNIPFAVAMLILLLIDAGVEVAKKD